MFLELEHCPLHFKIPKQLLNKLMPARDVRGDVTKECHTVSEVVKKVEKCSAMLIDEDRSNAGNFECDVLFLKGNVEKLMRQATEQMIFQALPSDGLC